MSANHHPTVSFRHRLPRGEIVRHLLHLAEHLAGSAVQIRSGAHSVTLRPPGSLAIRLRARQDADRGGIALCLSWTPEREDARAGPPADLAGPAELRQRFRDALFAGDYGAALQLGEEVCRRFPDSAMTSQFSVIRTVLRQRLPAPGRSATTAGTPPAPGVSAPPDQNA